MRQEQVFLSTWLLHLDEGGAWTKHSVLPLEIYTELWISWKRTEAESNFTIQEPFTGALRSQKASPSSQGEQQLLRVNEVYLAFPLLGKICPLSSRTVPCTFQWHQLRHQDTLEAEIKKWVHFCRLYSPHTSSCSPHSYLEAQSSHTLLVSFN